VTIGFESLQIANVSTADKIHEYVSNAIDNVKNIPVDLSFLNRHHFSVNKLLHTVKTEFPEDFYLLFLSWFVIHCGDKRRKSM
jgi:hypothetical protein